MTRINNKRGKFYSRVLDLVENTDGWLDRAAIDKLRPPDIGPTNFRDAFASLRRSGKIAGCISKDPRGTYGARLFAKHPAPPIPAGFVPYASRAGAPRKYKKTVTAEQGHFPREHCIRAASPSSPRQNIFCLSAMP